jgi:hypothetical protein
VKQQLQQSQGLFRYGLAADSFRKRFWTVSIWTTQSAMNAFTLFVLNSMRRRSDDFHPRCCRSRLCRMDQRHGSDDWNDIRAPEASHIPALYDRIRGTIGTIPSADDASAWATVSFPARQVVVKAFNEGITYNKGPVEEKPTRSPSWDSVDS